MSSRIAQVSIVVKKQSEALEFYTEKVGFKKKIDFPTPAGNRWIVVGPEGDTVGLALVEAGWPDDSGLGRTWKAGEAAPIVIQVDDCQKTYEELKSRGVEFKRIWGEEVKKVPYGTVAFFADPDGNLFEILQASMAMSQSSKAPAES
jgi:catechol 2,3-dioxygenase-like lactoylglutathione lyase family enzyme